MTKDEKIKAIEDWRDRWLDLDNQFDLLSSLVDGVTGKLHDAAWNGLSGYTEVLAIALNVDQTWLDWFAFDCEFGAKPLGASIGDEDMQDIDSVEKFVDFIERINEKIDTE
jgi:hypothetical protein